MNNEQETASKLCDVRLLTLNEFLNAVKISKSTWYNEKKEGKYPTPVRIGKRKLAWRERDVVSYIESLQPVDKF